jgi:hypothetical protein
LLLEAVHVGAEQVLGVGQGAAGLLFELEVAQLLGDVQELVRVFDFDDCGVEGLAGVAADLRHNLEVVASELLDDLGEGRAGVALDGEVVEVDDVGVVKLLNGLLLHVFCFFCLFGIVVSLRAGCFCL